MLFKLQLTTTKLRHFICHDVITTVIQKRRFEVYSIIRFYEYKKMFCDVLKPVLSRRISLHDVNVKDDAKMGSKWCGVSIRAQHVTFHVLSDVYVLRLNPSNAAARSSNVFYTQTWSYHLCPYTPSVAACQGLYYQVLNRQKILVISVYISFIQFSLFFVQSYFNINFICFR